MTIVYILFFSFHNCQQHFALNNFPVFIYQDNVSNIYISDSYNFANLSACLCSSAADMDPDLSGSV